MMTRRRGYVLGRLLAALDHLGHVPDVHRLYELASLQPRHLAGPLARATAAGEAERAYLTPLVAALPPDDPFADLIGQDEADFPLGYYHQRGDIAKGIPPGLGDDEMTAPQAAEALGIARTSVNRAIIAGRLAARRVGDIWLVQRAEVERYGREVRPGRQPAPRPGTAH